MMSRAQKRKEFDKAGFKEAEFKRISLLSNDELYKETVELAGGDDYDGDYTPEGSVTYPILLEELDKRLVKCNFLSKQVFLDEDYPVD